jgi:hypothetical protein
MSFLKNNALRYFEPSVVAKIEKMIDKEFEVGFRSDNGEVEVLLVDKKALCYKPNY